MYNKVITTPKNSMYSVYTCACKVETFYSPILSTPSIHQSRGVMDLKKYKSNYQYCNDPLQRNKKSLSQKKHLG